ncbi:hypothetical protein ACFE04_016442 [Oxalis oulophora]
MLLQPSLHNQQKLSFSSTLSYSRPPLLSKSSHITLPTNKPSRLVSITCSISKVHNYGTVDYEKRPMVKWNALYRRLSLMENPELGSKDVLNQWENEGKRLTKWDLCRVVKELRKFKRFDRALEIYEWMNNREERFRSSPSDAAIQLDLVAKVRGVSSAEDYFAKLPINLKDRRVYGSLLNAYVRAKMTENAESLMGQMRTKGYALQSLPFNVMMTLYMGLQDYDKVEGIVSEMMEKNIPLDIYTYNIWLSSHGARGSVERMEGVFERMKMDRSINPNWTTFSTMATMYIKMGEIEKAEDCLKKVESRITGRDKMPYHYLLSLYGSTGNKDEVYRVWSIYKSVFPVVPNLGYHAVISSLVRISDIEGAEKIYEEWLSIKTSYDPRIANLLMSWYIKEGDFEKVESLFDNITELGGKPNSSSWEILAEGHVAEKRISEALVCYKESFSAEGSVHWKPKASVVSQFFSLCEEESDFESKEELIARLRNSGFLDDEDYLSELGLSDKPSKGKSRSGDEDESQILLDQLQGGL